MLRPPERRRAAVVLVMCFAVLLLAAPPGCTSTAKKAPPTPPPPTFTGPSFLHGTVGSLASYAGTEPLLVSGYGLVVGLPGTGSTEVPSYLRQWMISEMRKRGVGDVQLRGILNASPEQILASGTAAVVAIEGFVPPGATRGMRFDVLVSALPQTQTTSLEGGRLWMADLSVGGTNPEMRFMRKIASASGAIYLNPFGSSLETDTEGVAQGAGVNTGSLEARPDRDRQGVVLSGGVVTTSRLVEIALNQPSWNRCRMMADRINERFPRQAGVDRYDTAEAKTDQLIQLNIPARFGRRPELLLDLVAHLYLQRGVGFEPAKANEIGELLVKNPQHAAHATSVWTALGKTAIPTIQGYYGHSETYVRLAALEAGAYLADEKATAHLDELAGASDPEIRKRAAGILVHLPRSLRGAAVLKRLLADDDQSVRIAAYESLARTGDPTIIQRTAIGEGADFKFVLDLVPSDRPLIYFSQRDLPRVAIFGPELGFRSSGVAKAWNNRLMVRGAGPDAAAAKVFYQPLGNAEPKTFTIAPTVANLIFLLGHKPTVHNRTEGLDLSYSQIANAVFELTRSGSVEAPMEVQLNPIAEMVAAAREQVEPGPRPETDDTVRPETDAAAPPEGEGKESAAKKGS